MNTSRRLLCGAVGFGLTAASAAILGLAPSAEATPVTASSVGSDFYMAFPTNYSASGQLTLAISGDTAGSGTVFAPAPGSGVNSQSFAITPGQVTQISVDPSWAVVASDGTEAHGIKITSSTPVSVYATNHASASSSGWLTLPTSALGTRYRALAYNGLGGYPSQLTVIASSNGTTATITPATTVGTHAAGVPFTVALDAGQVYQLQATAASQDVTGTVVTATAPVGVMGGAKCANIPANKPACDQVEQQLTPTDAWGAHFATVRYATRLKGDTYRVLADQDGTEVSVNGSKVATLNAGQFYETVLPATATTAGNDGVQIDATKPVEVAQYGNSSSYDGSTGDPMMLLVPPTGQYLDHYTIAAPTVSSDFYPYASVVVPTTDIGAVTLDGTAVTADKFARIGTSKYSGAQLTLALGTHTFAGPHGFGVQVYEWGNYDGFGYPGGYSLVDIGDAPGAPSDLSVTPGNGSASLTFTPGDQGGTPVTDYQYSTDGGATWSTLTTTDNGDTRTGTITGLTNGTTYTVKVRALNDAGAGTASDGRTVTPTRVTAPGAPTSVTAQPGDKSVSVSFMPPAADGGAAISGYEITTDGGQSWQSLTTTADSNGLLSGSLSGLTNGTAYQVAVRAANSVGGGTSSATSSVTPRTVPAAPTDVAAQRSDGGATVSFTVPADGGSTITGYEVSTDDGVSWHTLTTTGDATTRSGTVSGLTNGTPYGFTVRALNDAGTGATSDSAPVTPAAAPSAPTGVHVSPADGRALVDFTPADPNGADVTSYEVSTDGGLHWQPLATTIHGTSLVATVTGLTNGDIYAVSVRGVNDVGAGSASSATSVTPAPQVPNAPGTPTATAGTSSVTVSWPAASGVDGVTGYVVTAHPGQAGCVTHSANATTCVIGGQAGTAYTYTVTAINIGGSSLPSQPSNSATPLAPVLTPKPPASVDPSLTTTDGALPKVTPGQSINLVGTGFARFSTVKVGFYPDTTVLTTVVTDSTGAFTAPVTVPAGAGAGRHSFVAFGVTPTGTSRAVSMSSAVAGSPSTVPAPERVAVTPQSGALKIAFDRVAAPADSSVRAYQVSLDGGRTWRTVRTVSAGRGRMQTVVSGLKNGRNYHVRIRAVTDTTGLSGTGAASPSIIASPTLPWFHDPISPAKRRSEVRIPKHLQTYHGPRRITRAASRSHNGTIAVPTPWLEGHRLAAGQATTMGERGLFAFNSAVITRAGAKQIRLIAAAVRGRKSLICEGYSDYAGRDSHEKILSRARAVAVCAALRSQGVHANLKAVGYGGQRPVVVGGSARSRAENRRVVVLVRQ